MTTEILSTDAGDPTAVNPGAAIADIRARRAEGDAPRRSPGRPKGSGKGKSARKSSVVAPEPPVEPQEVTESDIAGAAILGGMVWKLGGGMLGLRELDKSERRELGEALAPVLAKYLPMMNEYAAEAALAVTLFGLWERTRIETPSGEVFDLGDGSEVASAPADE
jgi:hypothetical protein